MPSASRPGRRPDPATRQCWQQRLQRFHTSGLSVLDFCACEGISTASFYAWKRRLQTHAVPPVPEEPRFVPIRVRSAPSGAPVELVLCSGVILRLPPDTDLPWLRQLLDLLRDSPC
jgi:hypothetical protein